MVNPYSQATRTAFSPEKHSHFPLASWPLMLNSVHREEVPCIQCGGPWMCQKSKVQNSNGKGEVFSSSQALKGRPAPWCHQGVPTSPDIKRKKDSYFSPSHGFIRPKLQLLLKCEYVKINKVLVFTVHVQLEDLHGFSQVFWQLCNTKLRQSVCIVFSQGNMLPKVPCDRQKARAIKFKTSLYSYGGKEESLWRQLYCILYFYPQNKSKE